MLLTGSKGSVMEIKVLTESGAGVRGAISVGNSFR